MQAPVDAVEEQPHVLDDVGGAFGGRDRLRLLQQMLDIALRLGHVQAPGRDMLQRRQLRRLIGKPQQRPGMALRQARLPQALPHRLRQPQQPQLVGHGGLGAAQLFRRLLLTEPVAVDEPGDGGGLLEAVQIPALEILDEGQHPGVLLVHPGHQTGHLPQTRDPGGPQAALAGDQLIALLRAADGQGLQNAVGADAGGQLLQAGLVKMAAGLLGIGMQQRQGDVLYPGRQKIAFPAVDHGVPLLFLHCTPWPVRMAAICVGKWEKDQKRRPRPSLSPYYDICFRRSLRISSPKKGRMRYSPSNRDCT